MTRLKIEREARGAREGKIGLLCVLVAASCATVHPCSQRTELYFGLSKPAGGAVSAQEFDAFARDEIEKRFPSGFTVLDARGEWKGAAEPSKIVVLIHACNASDQIEELRTLYKSRFQQDSVLRVDTESVARF